MLPPQFPLSTGMVVDKHQNGIPGVWTIQSSQTAANMVLWLKPLVAKLRSRKPDWKPSCVIVDFCQAEINAVR
jgi:hypothetical protein